LIFAFYPQSFTRALAKHFSEGNLEPQEGVKSCFAFLPQYDLFQMSSTNLILTREISPCACTARDRARRVRQNRLYPVCNIYAANKTYRSICNNHFVVRPSAEIKITAFEAGAKTEKIFPLPLQVIYKFFGTRFLEAYPSITIKYFYTLCAARFIKAPAVHGFPFH